MKIRLLLALAGLAIGFTTPTFAQQQKETVDLGMAQQREHPPGMPRHLLSSVSLLKSGTRHSTTVMPPRWPRSSRRTLFW